VAEAQILCLVDDVHAIFVPNSVLFSFANLSETDNSEYGKRSDALVISFS
jgi:hypothetical protein